MNGTDFDPNRIAQLAAAADHRAAAVAQIRIGVAAQLLAPLLAQEYARGLAAGIEQAYPNGPQFGEQIDMSKVHVNFNLNLPMQVALGAADGLLQAAGVMK